MNRFKTIEVHAPDNEEIDDEEIKFRNEINPFINFFGGTIDKVN